MELLVNSIVGLVILVFDVVRGLSAWSGDALPVAVAGAAGSYLGIRIALTRYDRMVQSRAVAGR